MKTIAVFPGSFDPLTNGHFDLVSRASKTFDEVHLAVLDNPNKACLFTAAERVGIIEAVFAQSKLNVVASSFSGLLVDYVKRLDAQIILRGLRAISDYDYEAQMALTNRNLSAKIETFFLMATENHSYISSTLVKQIAPLGGDVSKMVPQEVLAALNKKLQLSA